MTFTIKLSKTLILMCGIILTSITHAQDYPVGKKSGTGGISRIAPINGVEGFEGAGWNAGNTKGTYSPGLDTSLPKYFKFKQFQGPHSFKAETSIVRFGQYSAKLHWKHNDPGQWNDDPNKIDNSDRKAMFHGQNASSNQATVWYGFSVYFPSASTVMNGEEEALFFQLHGGRDNNGEPNRVPPVALTFNKDEFKLGYSWDSNKISTDVRGEGQDHVHVPVTLSDYQDRWVDVVVQVRSNPFERNGFIKVWLDGKQMFNKTDIQLGYNDDQGIYPSYGWYIFWQNNLERNNDAIMYLDEIRQVEDTNADYYDVAPGYFANKGISTVNYCPNSNLNPADEVFGFKYAVAAKSLLTINQPTDIAYGAKGQFAYIYNQTTDITCDNSTKLVPSAFMHDNNGVLDTLNVEIFILFPFLRSKCFNSKLFSQPPSCFRREG